MNTSFFLRPIHFFYILFLCTTFNVASVSSAYAINEIVIDNGSGDILVPVKHFEVLEDQSGNLSINAILLSGIKNQFISGVNEDYFKLNKHYWIRFNIINNSHPDNHFLLQAPLHSEQIAIYVVLKNGSIREFTCGQDRNFDARPLDLRTIAVNLPSVRNEPYTIYIHVFAKKHHDLSYIITNQTSYIEVHTKGYLFLGIIYGILFLMAVYNFILYLSIREKIYIYYLLYILSSAFFLSWKDGLGFQFIWPGTPSMNSYHHSIGLFLLLTTFLFYSINFLELKKNHPKNFKIAYVIIGINCLYFILRIFDSSFFDPLPIPYLLSLLYFIGITFYNLIQGYKPARYLLVSLSCFMFSLLVLKLRYLGWMDWNWFVEYILSYAVAVDAIAMSLANRDKITYLRKEKEKAQEIKFQEEKLKTENELIQLKNEHLQSEVNFKNNELASIATNLAQKVELFGYLKKELSQISKEIPDNASLNKLIRSLDKGTELDDDWGQFQLNFDKSHNNYLANLREKYPALKPSDLLLCAYIKLNKSNKEIASLLNISVSGVEKKRTRLKEKLLLASEASLSDFLLHFK